MDVEFTAEIWHWRGPSPYYFLTVPEDACVDLAEAAAFVSYGWGMIPVAVRIGTTEWTTSLFPKDDAYVVPLKLAVRTEEGLAEGDVVDVRLSVDV